VSDEQWLKVSGKRWMILNNKQDSKVNTPLDNATKYAVYAVLTILTVYILNVIFLSYNHEYAMYKFVYNKLYDHIYIPYFDNNRYHRNVNVYIWC
jgi:hypothetical protein